MPTQPQPTPPAPYVHPGRVYCDQDYHPASDADADRWCQDYHRPTGPRFPWSP